jgi:hypothetical protein
MFYLSPGVYTREVDLTTTIPAVATSVGVNILRNTYKGPEHTITLVTNEDELVSNFGYPTDNSYQDLLSSVGFLKFGRNHYCTRVMPDDATFSGIKVLENYTTVTAETSAYTFDATGTNVDYNYLSLGVYDLSTFAEEFNSSLDASEVLRFIAKSRGAHGNNIRVLVVDKDVYYSVKYLDDGVLNLPSGYTVTDAASAVALDMYNDYVAGTDTTNAFAVIADINTTLASKKQFIVFVQAKDQGTDI